MTINIKTFTQENLLSSMSEAYQNPGLIKDLTGKEQNVVFSIKVGYINMEIPFSYFKTKNSLYGYIKPELGKNLNKSKPEEGKYSIFISPTEQAFFTEEWNKIISSKSEELKRCKTKEIYNRKLDELNASTQKVSYYYVLFSSNKTGKDYLMIFLKQELIRSDFNQIKGFISNNFIPLDNVNTTIIPESEIKNKINSIDSRLEKFKTGYISKMESLPFYSLEKINMYFVKNKVFTHRQKQATEMKQKEIAGFNKIQKGIFETFELFQKEVYSRISKFGKGQNNYFEISGLNIRYLNPKEGANIYNTGLLLVTFKDTQVGEIQTQNPLNSIQTPNGIGLLQKSFDLIRNKK